MQSEDLVGQLLGHYRVKKQIGYGGMATVFLAQDIHLGREIALKVFWPRPGETQDFLSRFLREARVLAQLDHPHILPVYDYGEEGKQAFLVMPYMSGGSLKEVLQHRKVLPPSEAVQLISQVLPALQYAHDRGLIHRDIKPGNFLFKNEHDLVLADFGLVKVVGSEQQEASLLDTLTETGQNIVGTPEYMAPEQIEGKVVPASDIYAMGAVLYEMVTGVRPFAGDTVLNILVKQVRERPRPPREINPYISPQLEAVVLRSLEKVPNKRFARPLDFQQALIQSSNRQSARAVNPISNAGLIDEGLWLGGPTQPDLPASDAAYRPTIASKNAPAPAPPVPPRGLPEPNLPRPSAPRQTTSPSNAQAPLVLPSLPDANSVNPYFQPGQQWMPPPTVPPLSARISVQPAKRRRWPLAILVILLLAGLGASLFLTPVRSTLLGLHASATPTASRGTPIAPTSTPSTRFTVTPTVSTGTGSLSGISTACPVAGTARAAVTAPLTSGPDTALVYIANERDANGSTLGAIKAYDIVTAKETIVAQMNKTVIDEAQISNDGQWVLFVATVAGQEELRLVRLDGQGLQTLLCVPGGVTIRGSEWSVDQQHVIFDEFPQVGEPSVYLLNTQTGLLQVEVSAPESGAVLLPRTWLDDNRVLMVSVLSDSDAAPQSLSVLKISDGANQSYSTIQTVFTPSQPEWDCDTSYDGNTFFIAQALPGQPSGSSAITKQSAGAISSTPVLISSDLALGTVRVIDAQSTYLLTVASDATPSNPDGDPQHDGLYLINTSNSTTQRLVSTLSGQSLSLNAYSQYFWSNISRDGNMYALETSYASTHSDMLSYGPLSGGASTVLAQSSGVATAVVGWTTIG